MIKIHCRPHPIENHCCQKCDGKTNGETNKVTCWGRTKISVITCIEGQKFKWIKRSSECAQYNPTIHLFEGCSSCDPRWKAAAADILEDSCGFSRLVQWQPKPREDGALINFNNESATCKSSEWSDRTSLHTHVPLPVQQLICTFSLILHHSTVPQQLF